MRICIICENYYPSLDATSKRMRTFADCLIDSGHDVQVIASVTSLLDAPQGFEAPDNVHYYDVFGRQGEHNVIRRSINNLSGVVNSRKAALSAGKFDVVICTSPPLMLSLSALSVSKRNRAKYVFDIRDIWPDIAYEMGSFSERSIYARVFQWIADISYDGASLISVVSPSKLKKLSAKLSSANRSKLTLIENGLDAAFLREIDSAAFMNKYDFADNPPCVYIGKLGFAQGLSRLLDIAERYPEIRFLLFGNGAEEKDLRKESTRRGLNNVSFEGRISAQEAKTALSHARCTIIPLKSSSMKDSVPTKLYEALGCGCPVLLLAQGDSAELLNECSLGFAVPPEDKEGAIEAFGRLISADWTMEQRKRSKEIMQAKHLRQTAAMKLERLLVKRFSR